MKALSIDGAIGRLTISAKNDDYSFTSIYDIGMKQSQSIVPGIDYVLKQVELKPSDLDYACIAVGPGSFTGLRLAVSAVKAIELANDIPVYGISTLNMYSYCFNDFDLPVLSAIDANKNKFYANLTDGKNTILEDGDWEIDKIISSVKKIKKLIICGPDCDKLKNIIEEKNKKIKIYTPKSNMITTEALFAIAEKNMADKIPPMKDFDGPVYLRASEAEIVKNNSSR